MRLTSIKQRDRMLTGCKLPVIEVDHLLKSEYDNVRLFCRTDAFFQELCVLGRADEITRFAVVDIPTTYQYVDVTVA